VRNLSKFIEVVDSFMILELSMFTDVGDFSQISVVKNDNFLVFGEHNIELNEIWC